MTDANIFKSNEDPSTSTNGVPSGDNHSPTHTPPAQQSDDNPLAAYVGEGKKYRDYGALAKAIDEKDSFIEQLKKEGQGMREDIQRLQEQQENITKQGQSKDALEEVLDAIKASRLPSEADNPLTPEEVKQIAIQAQKENATEAQMKQNFDNSQQAVVDFFEGDFDKASKYVAEKAAALSLSREKLEEIAKQSPKAFTELMGVSGNKSQPPASTMPGGRSVSEGAYNKGPTVDTFAHFEQLRRENPKEYWDPKTQQRMFKLAKENPQAFYGRNK